MDGKKPNMKVYNKITAIVFAILLALSISACTPKGSAENFYYFNTVIHVETHGTVLSANTKAELSDLFSKIENEFDSNRSGSIVNAFNQMDKSEELILTNDANTVLTIVKYCYEFSDGKFNPCIYPLTKLWGFAPYSFNANFTPPTAQEIENAKSECDFNNLIIDNLYLKKTQDYLKLDLGGIVKGYATDKALKLLLNDGHQKGYVSVGSSSLALLNYPSLGIKHPDKSGSIITCSTAGINKLCVSTSGDYEKFYVDSQGVKYCHIIDPDTGYPTQTGVRSATILGVDGAIGDALTTAICLKNHDGSANSKLVQFLNKIISTYPNSSVYVLYEKEGLKQLLTNKLDGKDFTLHDNEFSLFNI